jgi:hypothetical protein
MKKTMIVTDLTRFSTPDKVCVAVIDQESGKCMRPMPYFSSELCKKHNLQPGAILTGKMELTGGENPHVEDASYDKLTFIGPCTSEVFQNILKNSLSPSVACGFGYDFSQGQKHIPYSEVANCSIITIKVRPQDIEIHEDQYKPGKIKLTFTDSANHQYRYIGITDRGFYDYAMKHQSDGKLYNVQSFIERQKKIYLRIGLSRRYSIQGRDGYWLQVNGIYTFPEYQKDIRIY